MLFRLQLGLIPSARNMHEGFGNGNIIFANISSQAVGLAENFTHVNINNK